MASIVVQRESESTKAQLVTLTQQEDDNTQVIVGSDKPLISIDINHQRLHEGRAFYVHYYKGVSDKLANNASIDLVFAAAPGVSPHLHYSGESGGDAELLLYESPTTTGGTAITPICMRRVNPQSSDVAMVANPTVSSTGTLLNEVFVPGGAASGNNKNAGSAAIGQEWVLAPLTNYLVRLTNRSGSSEVAHLSLYWYE